MRPPVMLRMCTRLGDRKDRPYGMNGLRNILADVILIHQKNVRAVREPPLQLIPADNFFTR